MVVKTMTAARAMVAAVAVVLGAGVAAGQCPRPVDLQVVGNTCAVELRWSNLAGAPTPTSWVVMRGTAADGSDATAIATLDGGVMTYTDVPSAGVVHAYFVRSVALLGQCFGAVNTSAVVTGQRSPLSVVNLRVETVDCGSARVAWDMPPGVEWVQVWLENDGTSQIVENYWTQGGAAAFANLTPATEYVCYLQAWSTCGGYGDWTQTVFVTPASATSAGDGVAAFKRVGETVTLTFPVQVNVAGGAGGFATVRRNGQVITSATGGGRITVSPLGTAVTIAGVRSEDEGEYVWEMVTGCGTVSSRVVLAVARGCIADADESGAVSVQDLFAYLAAYFAGCP